MTFFLALALLLLLFSSSRSSIFLWVSFAVLFVLSAFRDISVGTDTRGYYMLFERLRHGIEIRQEFLWQLVNKAVLFFGGDFETLLVISTLLVLIPLFFVVKKNSINPSFSIFLYYTLYLYLPSLNITRQAIAISIVLLALTFLQNRRKLWFVGLVLIATGFHITAFLAIPLLFINKLPDEGRDPFYYSVSAVTIFIGIFLSETIYRIVGGSLGYLRYVEAYELGTFVGNFLYLLILNAFLYFIMRVSDDRGFLFKLFFVFIVVTNLSIRMPFGDRFVLYFAIGQILFLPYLVSSSKVNPKQTVSFVVIIYAFVMFFRKFGAGDILPYINTLF